MRLTTKGRFAVTAMLDLALHGGQGPVTLAGISRRQGISLSYLEQLFGKLRRHMLVDSVRGPGGGYTLARTPARISLREVVEAVEGPLGDALAMEPAVSAGAKSFRPDFLWPTLAARFSEVLEETTLEKLCGAAVRAEVERVEGDPPMYFI